MKSYLLLAFQLDFLFSAGSNSQESLALALAVKKNLEFHKSIKYLIDYAYF